MNDTILETCKTILAVYGAVLSTFLAIANFYRDRARITITVKGGWRSTGGYGNANLVIVKVANKGRRPVTINKCSLLLPFGNSHRYVLCLDSITAMRPVELGEGKAHDYVLDEDELQKQNKIGPSQYVAVVYDATGKSYWSHGFIKTFFKLWRLRR